MSVFLVLIFFSGASCASSEINQTLTTEYNDEIVNVEDTDEKLTVEVSSAGSDDDSGLKELDSEIQENKLNKTNFIKKENNLLKASNDNQLLGATINVEGSTFTDIQNAINRAREGDTIHLNSPLYTGSGTEITIDKSLTIIGSNRCTLDAQGLSRIIHLNPYANLIINNITFVNGINEGGALLTDSGGKVNCSKCIFFNNTATGYGGALWFSSMNSIISNCIFFNNTATSDGGAVFNRGNNNTFENCIFINNTGLGGGAFYNIDSQSKIYNSKFINNTATSTGGAIHSWRNIYVSNSTFINNKAGLRGVVSVSSGKCYLYDCILLDNKNGYGSQIRPLTNNSKLILRFWSANVNIMNSLYYNNDFYYRNITYYNGDIVNSDNVTPIKSWYHPGINITLEIYDQNNNLIDNITSMTDINGQISYDYSTLPDGKYSYKAYHIEDNYYIASQTSDSFDVNKYNIIILNNNTNNVKQNQKTKITAKITDINNATIKPEGNKLIFILLKYTKIITIPNLSQK